MYLAATFRFIIRFIINLSYLMLILIAKNTIFNILAKIYE